MVKYVRQSASKIVLERLFHSKNMCGAGLFFVSPYLLLHSNQTTGNTFGQLTTLSASQQGHHNYVKRRCQTLMLYLAPTEHKYWHLW